ncbi:MAG: RHS repeat-associated core domain-containing protein, partial [Candidatus Onthovivens sp.]|nr:RHS repeat-associated core domain-containing protein [Mollicutes bacterium]MDY4182952.1 RHS repeat-associated core domain-containing protein [Candidatus Onthovivens sp.]MDY6058558.1 RHS repeat-associated core domain-containing protein [Candidatus Onthovivens sp.]
ETTEYFYEGNNLVLETCNNYKIYYYYDENNDLIGFKYNNQMYYYIRNTFKTIEKVIDSNGNIVISYRYDPYGKVIMTTKANNAPINHFLYKGYYYDDETGLAMVGQRYYSPELCRFIQPADVSSLNPHSINGLNLYAYANNNPTGKAKLLSFTNVGTLCGFTTNILIPSLNLPNFTSKVGNDNYWNPHWENKWFDTDWPGFFVLSQEGFEVVNWSLSIYKGSLYLDNNENNYLYISAGNVGVYAGVNYKKGIGINASANVLELGFDGKIFDANVEGLSVGLTYMYKDGKLELKHGYGWWGWSVSIDFVELFKWLFGGE